MKPSSEWDEDKAAVNYDKHGVGFEEGVTIFYDPLSISIDDPGHSAKEERYLGRAVGGRSLLPLFQASWPAAAHPDVRKSIPPGNTLVTVDV
jgi:uncharacterized DUF497 family protein